MEKPLFFTVLYIGFGLLITVSGFPIDFSSVGTGEPNPLWLTTYILTAVGFLLAVIGVIFACVCCRNGTGFKEFSNSSGSPVIPRSEGFVNPTSSAELTIFPPAGVNSNQICRFEPLPDIKPQVPNLRPAAFSYSEREISSQDWFSEPYNNFPRNQLKYVQEYGRGWFGRVVEGEAQNIIPKEKLTKVMVKILHEDATPTDQMYFLHEVKFYRDLKHPNILSLLGRCLETEPFLIILENYPNGDLKSFLSQNLASAQALAEQGVTLQMCSNITSGLQFMHENKFIHTDLAARNCLVGPDLTVKIGDYGNSIEIFKSDYYCAGSVALPVRWCAPETLKCTDVTIETREVTPPANIWSLAVVFWEICEFCKLPYAELNDDQVIVRVLGEKNHFLEKPNMFCLHKDELYHLMKLCWNAPVQRPTASQIHAILDNLISSGKITQQKIQIDSKRISQDFEQRWQNLKPNYIPKRDNAVDIDYSANCNIISPKLINAKVVDSSLVDSPLGIFMSNTNSGQESPRFCLKSEKDKSNRSEENSQESVATETINSIEQKCKSDDIESGTDLSKKSGDDKQEVNFEYSQKCQPPEILNKNQKFNGDERDVDSWLKGVEINNEEDETFVRKISEAIRDLDAALAMEKTSSSEETSGKSSHQNSPGKDLKENNSETVVDFKLGADTSSFINFTQKSFELSSLQNTEQPQSLNFTDPFLTDKKSEFDDNYGPSSLIMPVIDESKSAFKNDGLDESLKESRNSSDTDDEIWRKRIERGEISEKVKEKSKSIANLMILTHIDASDDSDIDLDKPFDRNSNRNSFLRRSGSFARSSLSSNNFGSENDITYTVLEDDFKESLKKLSNDHKEHGHFDSLGMILPTSSRRENIWENIMKSSEPTGSTLENPVERTTAQTDVHKARKELESEKEKLPDSFPSEGGFGKSTETSNNFLGNVASEKIHDNKLIQEKNQDGASSDILYNKNVEELDCFKIMKKGDIIVDPYSHCDNSTSSTDSGNSSEKNSSHLKGNVFESDTIISNNTIRDLFPKEEKLDDESLFILSDKNLNKFENKNDLISASSDEGISLDESHYKDPIEQNGDLIDATVKNESFAVPNNFAALQPDEIEEKVNIETVTSDVKSPSNDPIQSSPSIPDITVTEAKEEIVKNLEEVFEPIISKCKPFKFVLKDSSFIPQITITEEPEEEYAEEEEENLELNFNSQNVKPLKFVLKDTEKAWGVGSSGDKKMNSFIPQISITEEPENESLEDEISVFDNNKTEIRPFKFVLKDESVIRDSGDFRDKDLKEDACKTEELNENKTLPISLNDKYHNKYNDISEKYTPDENGTVIIGACEDYTLDYFKGLKTASGGVSAEGNIEEGNQNLQQIIEDLRNKEDNLDVWDKHLDKAFYQQLKNADFNDITFKSFSLDSSELEEQYVKKNDVSKDNNIFECLPACPVEKISNFLDSEKNHTEKVEMPIHINPLTNLTGNVSEEEYDNFKLRTPDDERSSDSGFRDKGSLSESVEDACEGKYNLEDIEAELEEAYVKGAFGNCEVDKEKDLVKDSKNSNNFEYEESKFYEEENKNEEDFSDIDGEIEFWQNKDNSDYYPEISEFNPTCSRGWYLHPPEENGLPYNRNVNEDIVNALRNELRENLPIQTRSFDEFTDDFYEPEMDDTKRDMNIQYISDFAIPLSPIIEEQDSLSETTKKNIKNSLLDGHTSNKIRKNIVNIMESVKSIDTDTFMQYLDYMIENEGRDLDEIEEVDESMYENNDEGDIDSPLVLIKDDDNRKNNENKNFEEEIKNALGIDSISRSESSISEGGQSCGALMIEDLESGSTSKLTKETKPEDDLLVVNIDTNEAKMLESPKPKSYTAFLDTPDAKKDSLEVITDNSENDGLIFTPECLSPDRERSLSELSRSSNGTRTGDALSEITLSSPDLVPDCFSTSIHEIQNNEANEIINDLKSSGIINENTPEKMISSETPQELTEEDIYSLPFSSSKPEVQNDLFLLRKRQYTSDILEKSQDFQDNMELSKSEVSEIEDLSQNSDKTGKAVTNDLYEMSTSFMGDDNDDENDSEQKENAKGQKSYQKCEKELGIEDSYTADWESDSSGGEEMSSSSGEFIWKDGDKEAKLKAVQATDCDAENSLYEKSQSDHSIVEPTTQDVSQLKEDPKKEKILNEKDDEDNDDDDNESSTGSSASITDFIPSAWNSQAIPSRPALKSPDKKTDHQLQKKNVWFKKQKYHCVYEYPREPSDNEEPESSPYNQFSYEKSGETPNKHFTFGVNTVELPNRHFPYGISNVIDFSSFADWDILEGDEGDLSLTDTDSDNGGFGKTDQNSKKEPDFNFYNISPFDFGFDIAGMLNDESEFFVSSSSRPFQGGSSTQFFPGNSQKPDFGDFNSKSFKSEESEQIESTTLNSRDFVTPDSGVEDSTPSDKKVDINNESMILQVENPIDSKEGIIKVLDNLKFNFTPEIVANNVKKIELEAVGDKTSSSLNGLSSSSSNSPSSPLSPTGLGELRHTRDRLKLDLPRNHNAELGAVINNKKNQQNSLKS